MSLKKSCSCRFLVPVETTTRLPERIAGTRYASVLPVPVPASTIRCFFSASARFHGFGHFQLAGAIFVVRVPLRKHAVPREELMHAGYGFDIGGHAGDNSIVT